MNESTSPLQKVLIKSMTSLLRPQTAGDIANLAAFPVSGEAGNLTGQSINLDGGTVMH